MDIILLERIEKLGEMGETVHVKDGFARNFLLPQGKALRANKTNRERFEAERATLEARNAERRDQAQTDVERLDGESFIVLRQAGESGQLYGSVSTRDIAQVASQRGGVSVTRNQVQLDQPIKTIGLYSVRIALHPEVHATVTVNVARTEDEAEAQASGVDLSGPVSEREQALAAAEELFEEEAAGEVDALEEPATLEEAEATPADDESEEENAKE